MKKFNESITKQKKIIIIIVCLIIIFIVLSFGQRIVKKNKGSSDSFTTEQINLVNQENVQNEQLTNNEIMITETTTAETLIDKNTEKKFKNSYMIDYMILANHMIWSDISNWNCIPEGPDVPNEIINGFELYDIDDDKFLELLITANLTNLKPGERTDVILTFDVNEGIYSVWRDLSAAGSSELLIDENNQTAYLKKTYNTAYSYMAYNNWTEQGWYPNTVLEKQENDVMTSKWNCNEISENKWHENEKKISSRTINDNINNYLTTKSEDNAKNTAETIYEYYKNKNIVTYLLENPNSEEYYIVITDYYDKTWTHQVNEDVSSDDVLLTRWVGGNSFIVIIKNTSNGSIINSQYLDRCDISNAEYDNGIVIEENGIKYKYEIDGTQLKYLGKINNSNIEKILIEKKWYTINSWENIIEYKFKNNGTILCTVYEKNNEVWNCIDQHDYYTYSYNADNNELLINYGQDGQSYIYTEEGFIANDKNYTYSSDNNINQKCLITYESIPEFNTLKQDCHNLLEIVNGIDYVIE